MTGLRRRPLRRRLGPAVLVAAIASSLGSLPHGPAAAGVPPAGLRLADTSGTPTATGRALQTAPTISPAVAAPGQQLRVDGKLTPAVARPLQLQLRTASGWVTATTGKTNRRGKYHLTTPAPATAGPATYRVHAKPFRVKVNGTTKGWPAQSTRPRTITVAAAPAPVQPPTPTVPGTPVEPGAVSVAVSPTQPTVLQVSPELRISVPAGATDRAATLTYTPAAAPTGTDFETFDFLAWGDVELTSGQPLKPLTFTWTLDDPLPAGWQAAFFSGDPDTDPFTALPTAVSPDGRTLSAQVPHLSEKGLGVWFEENVSRLAGQVLTHRGDRPTCSGQPPAWVASTIYVDQGGGDNPMLACVGQDPDPAHSDRYVVKLTNNRGHGLMIDLPARPQWVHLTNDGGLGDQFVALMTRLRPTEDTQILLAPGQQIHLGFDQADLESVGDPFVIRASVNVEAVLFGLTLRAAEEAFGDLGKGSAIAAALMVAKCLPAWESGGDDITDIVAAAAANLQCFVNVDAWADLGIEAFGKDKFYDMLPLKKQGVDAARKLVKKVNRYLLIFSLSQEFFDLTGSLAQQSSVPAVFQLTTSFAPPNISTIALPAAVIGSPYDERLTTTDDRAGAWSIVTGALPAGLSLNAATGTITGNPEGPGGASAFTVKFTDAHRLSATRDLVLDVGHTEKTAPAQLQSSLRFTAVTGVSTDGSVLTYFSTQSYAMGYGTVASYDTTTNEETLVSGSDEYATGLATSGDGRFVLYCSFDRSDEQAFISGSTPVEMRLQLWDRSSGQTDLVAVREVTIHAYMGMGAQAAFRTAALSDDGQTVAYAAVDDGELTTSTPTHLYVGDPTGVKWLVADGPGLGAVFLTGNGDAVSYSRTEGDTTVLTSWSPEGGQLSARTLPGVLYVSAMSKDGARFLIWDWTAVCGDRTSAVFIPETNQHLCINGGRAFSRLSSDGRYAIGTSADGAQVARFDSSSGETDFAVIDSHLWMSGNPMVSGDGRSIAFAGRYEGGEWSTWFWARAFE